MHDDAFQLEKDTHQRESFPHYEQDRHDAPDIRLGMVQQDVEKTFWMTYNKEADAFDGERLDAWNKSLDVLLIFAGLFSAINTAFILEAYKGLKTDQAELTNKLLTLQLIHRNDGTIFTQDSLSNLVNTEPLATPVNCIYFSSLFCSVTAAFGAVTAKQWLKEYASIGSIMTQADLGRRRQRRYDGMNKWGFSSVMALLPILLQISLILFLVGTVMFLWKVNFPVTFTFLCLFIFIVLVALTFMIIGAVHPWSPFQSLTANASRRLFYKPANIIKSGIQSLAKRLAVAARYPLDATGVVDHHSLHTIIGMQHNHEHAYPPVVPPNSSDVVDTENMNEDLCYQWNGDESEVVSVQSVLWILDQGDHPDTMLVALAMFPKLPRALLLRMLSDPHRAGLLQRIGSFYTSQLHAVPKSRGPDPGLSPASIISGLALHHVLQARSSLYDPKNRREPLFEAFCTTLKTRKPKYDPKGGRIGVVAAILEHAIYHQNGFNRVLQQLCDDDNIGSLRAVLTNPDLDLPVGLPISDRTQASPNVSWMTLHISPFRITLDCIIRDVIHNHRYWDAHKLEKLHTLIEDAWNVDEDKASSFVSCIALAIASLNWAARDKSKLAWNYRSEQEELWLESSLLFNCLALEKRKPDDYFVNVALAVSMFDVAVFQEKKGQMIVQLLPYLLQPKDLDRLVGSRSTSIWDTSPEDLPGVVNLLFLCSKAASGSKSSWLSLKHDDYGETISGILSASFQSSATLGAMEGAAFLLCQLAADPNCSPNLLAHLFSGGYESDNLYSLVRGMLLVGGPGKPTPGLDSLSQRLATALRGNGNPPRILIPLSLSLLIKFHTTIKSFRQYPLEQLSDLFVTFMNHQMALYPSVCWPPSLSRPDFLGDGTTTLSSLTSEHTLKVTELYSQLGSPDRTRSAIEWYGEATIVILCLLDAMPMESVKSDLRQITPKPPQRRRCSKLAGLLQSYGGPEKHAGLQSHADPPRVFFGGDAV